MSTSITLSFDNAWALRLKPMVEQRVSEARANPVIVSLIDALPTIDSVDDLTPKQQTVLWILFKLLCELSKFEGNEAAETARQTIVDDINSNFPLEVGDV